ncbi:ankyrin repeat [Fusarium albosuccineum]|uniref:Ankyrin repeat n=1 Tax=Fusarium albosuccineum TaxID=1237068 RepID=A0A8H4P4T4_9HYPO|nr:ankyrin repeat [Fusarium albosuccineum]
MTPTQERQVTRRLHRFSCVSCRRDKQRCDPEHRAWPQICDRCKERGWPCSKPIRASRARKPKRDQSDEADDSQQHPQAESNELTAITQNQAEWTWSLTDLQNALGLLQLVAATCSEPKAALCDAKSQLPKLWFHPYKSNLMSEVIRRLETEQYTATKQLLMAAIPAIAEPCVKVRFQEEHDKNLADIQEKHAKRLVKDGQICLGILFLSKSMAHSQKQPSKEILALLKFHDIPSLMNEVSGKFGLKTGPGTWRWPSMVLPHVRQLPREAITKVTETLVIKNWIGFDDALGLLGQPFLRGAFPKDWKNVFRYICRHPKESTRMGSDGRTSLHIAVLLGMVEEVKILMTYPHCRPAQQDNAQQTALHLAAIIGQDAICDLLLSTGDVNSGILLEDSAGRSSLWYAAGKGKDALFENLPHHTLPYKNMNDICAHRDKDGNSLLDFTITNGLQYPELLLWTNCTDIKNFYPDRYAIPNSDDLSQLLLNTGVLNTTNDSLSPSMGGLVGDESLSHGT